jgi:hypothetical protein
MIALLFFAAAAATQVVYCALRSVTYWKTVAVGKGFADVATWWAAGGSNRGHPD